MSDNLAKRLTVTSGEDVGATDATHIDRENNQLPGEIVPGTMQRDEAQCTGSIVESVSSIATETVTKGSPPTSQTSLAQGDNVTQDIKHSNIRAAGRDVMEYHQINMIFLTPSQDAEKFAIEALQNVRKQERGNSEKKDSYKDVNCWSLPDEMLKHGFTPFTKDRIDGASPASGYLSKQGVNPITVSQSAHVESLQSPPDPRHTSRIEADSESDISCEASHSTLQSHMDSATGKVEADSPRSISAETPPRTLQRPPPTVKRPASPTGPGWFKLSEQTYMCNEERIKARRKIFKGKQLVAGKWIDVAIKLIGHNKECFDEVKCHLALEKHPSVIKMYDAGVIPGLLVSDIYIAMELCWGTLKDFIAERKADLFDFRLYFSFANQIISGIAHIHENNILHRDIQLENIFLSKSKTEVRVAGLGLSTLLPQGHSAATVGSRRIGADGYRAPEIHLENPKPSRESDTFSLGIVLAMLFSNGRHPFGPDASKWRPNISEHKKPDLSHIFQFPESYSYKRELLLKLVEECLHPNPRNRPTPKQMLGDKFFS